MLHAGGEGLHTSRDGPDGEAGLDQWIRVREDGLDHLQNISVPAAKRRWGSASHGSITPEGMQLNELA